MNIATLGVAIDPTPATVGAAAANKALDSVAAHAEKTDAAVNKMSKNSGSAFGAMVQRIVGFINQLTFFMPGISGLFAQITTGAASAAASMASTAASGGALVAVLGPLAIGLAAVVGAFVALGVAAAGTWKAIGVAADIQRLTFHFEILLGSASKAKERIAELERFAAVTPFELPGIVMANKNLEVMSKGILSTIPQMTMIGDAASFSGQRFEDFAVVVGRVYAAIKGNRALGDEAMRLQEWGVLTVETRNKIEALQKTHADSRKIWALVEADMKRFSGTMAGESRLWTGLMSTARDNWRALQAAFGEPILIALTPLLQAFTQEMPKFETAFRSAGQAVAETVVLLTNLFRNGQLAEAFWLVFRIEGRKALAVIGESMLDTLTLKRFRDAGSAVMENGLGNMFRAAGDVLLAAVQLAGLSFIENMTRSVATLIAGAKTAAEIILNPLEALNAKANFKASYDSAYGTLNQGGDLKKAMVQLEQASIRLVNETTANYKAVGLNTDAQKKDTERLTEVIAQNKGYGGVSLKAFGIPQTFDGDPFAPLGGGSGEYFAPTDKGFKTDQEIIDNLRRTTEILKQLYDSKQLTPKELIRRSDQATTEATNQLSDPAGARDKYPELISKYQAFQAERARIAEETEQKIRAGAGTTADVFASAFDSIIQKWGNAQQQMVQGIQDITQSIANNLSGAITAFVTGSKDAKTAFRDMAVAILNDIARIITQMLVQLAIQAALKALGFGGGGSVGGASAPTNSWQVNASGPVAAAEGGPITGGRGGIDDVPAWLTRGEFVIPKNVVDAYGVDFFEKFRRAPKFASGGIVGTSAPTRGSSSDGGVNVTVNVDVHGKSDTKTEGGSDDDRKKGEKLGREFEQMTLQIIQREQRPGGTLARR